MGMLLWLVGSIVALFAVLALTFGLIRWFSPSRTEKIMTIAEEWGWRFREFEDDPKPAPDYVTIAGISEVNLAHEVSGTHQSVEFHVFEHRYRLTGQHKRVGATTAAFPLPEGTPAFHILPNEQARSLPEEQLEALGKHSVSFNYYDSIGEQYEIRADNATEVRNFLSDDGLDFLDDPENDEWRLDSDGRWLNLWLIEGNWISEPVPFRDTLEQFIRISSYFAENQNKKGDENEEE